MDCGPRRYLAAISLRGESNNLESRIERVSGMYFFENLAGRLGKPDEQVSDVLRKERCSGCREREYLQPCQAKDLTIGSRPELIARCADVACPCRPSRNLWRYRGYTGFPISFCNELVTLSILRCRERNAWNRSAVSGGGSDPW